MEALIDSTPRMERPGRITGLGKDAGASWQAAGACPAKMSIIQSGDMQEHLAMDHGGLGRVRERQRIQNAINELQRRVDFETKENAWLRRILQRKENDISSLKVLLGDALNFEKEVSAKAKELEQQLASEKKKRELAERLLSKVSQLGLLFDQLDEDEREEVMYLKECCPERLLEGEDGKRENSHNHTCRELRQRSREEFFKQEAFLRKALQDKEDIIADYEEQINAQDEELEYVESSAQEFFKLKEGELQALSEQVQLLQEEKEKCEQVLQIRDEEISAMEESLRCVEVRPQEAIQEALKESIDAKVEEIAKLRVLVDELLEKRREKEDVEQEKLMYQKYFEVKSVQDQAAMTLIEKETELENFKMAAMEELRLKEEENEFIREEVAALQESTGAAERELCELNRQMAEAAASEEHSGDEHPLKDREVELLEQVEHAEPRADQREFTEQTMANCYLSLREKETRITELEESVAQSKRDYEDLEEKLKEKQAELETLNVKAKEALSSKEGGNEATHRKIVALKESAPTVNQELGELKRKIRTRQDITQDQQFVLHKDGLGQKQEGTSKETMDVLKAREVELMELLGRAEQTVRQKEAIITATKKFVEETATKFQSVLEEKDTRIAELEDSVGRSTVRCKELGKKLEASQKLADEQHEEMSALKIKESSLEETRARLENNLVEIKGERDMLERTLSTKESESEKMEEGRKVMEKTITELTEEKSKNDKTLEEALTLCEETRKRDRELEENLSTNQEQIAVYESQLWQLKSSLQALESEKEVAEKENWKMVAELRVIKKVSSERDEKAQKYRTRMRAAKKETARLARSLESTTKAVEVTKSELEQCRMALSKSVGQMEEAKEKYEEGVRRQGKLSSHNQVLNVRLKGMEELLAGEQRKVENLGMLLEKEKENRTIVEHYVEEISERLQLETKQNETFGSALQKLGEGLQKLQQENTGMTVLMKDGTSRIQVQIDNFQKTLDDKGKLLLEASKQKEVLFQELKKFQDAEQSDVKKITENFLNTLVRDKASLTERLSSLESENKCLIEEKAELQGLLKSTNFTISRLDEEVSTLKELASDKEIRLVEALETAEALNSENRELTLHLKDLDDKLFQEAAAKNEIGQELEQVKTELEGERSDFEKLLTQNDDRSKKSEKEIDNLRGQVEKLEGQLEGVEKRFENEKKLASRLRKENDKLEADNKSLRRGNEVYQNAVKHKELQALKLETTEESLCREKEVNKQLVEQLLDANTQRRSFLTDMKEFRSKSEEIRQKMEFRIQSLQSENHQLREQRDERNKEFYALREENSLCDMRRRDAELKVKELENTLKNESSLQEAALRRKHQLEQDIQKLREDKCKEIAILKAALSNTARGVMSRESTSQLPRKIDLDNQTIEKMCELHQRISELKDELQEKGAEELRVHAILARTQAELSVLRETVQSNTDLNNA